MNPTTITAQPGTPYIDVVREFDAPGAGVPRTRRSRRRDDHPCGPLILGGGTPLFPGDATVRLELLESEMTACAQHLTYRVLADN